jgi:glycosyltransferase involved in cell wall biosynthesis
MRKLRIAIVAPSLGILGGQAVQANRLVEAWRGDREVDAWLVPVNPDPPPGLAWATRVKYLRTIATQTSYAPLLVRELAQADVVHVFSASYSSFLLAPLPAMLAARALGRPVVLNYRSGQAEDHLRRSAIARRAIASADSRVVPSAFLVEVFARFGIAATVIPNLLDLDRFAFRPTGPLRPRLVSTRNFEPLYNVACTLRAFRRVQARWPDATLTLVGAGPEEERLRALAATLGLRHVRFAGRVEPGDIARHYRDNDIYIQSPNIDNMPTSVLEAFATGIPVVSTGAGGIPTILTHGVHGLLAPIDDHETLAGHVLELLDNAAFARRLIHAAYSTCHACTWSAVREQWLRVYQLSLAAARAARLRTEHAA